MRISQISLKNFKSFPYANIRLSSGFNCIVGPNGGGKSNIIDSLLFAFGDSSLKAMRVKKTSDLIHQNNKVAQVTVNLIDKDGKNYEVSRMIRRDGLTKYLLNGKRVKKQGISEFLSSNSLSNSNIIIKQGEVQRIVEMNSKDRRGLLDQVANVSEYEQKKKEALGELQIVEAKLNEASTVLGEREGFLKELEKERESAIRFKDLASQRDSLKSTLLSIDISSFENDLTSNINSRLDIQSKISITEKNIQNISQTIEVKNNQKDDINREILSRGAGKDSKLQMEIDSLNVTIQTNKNIIEQQKTEITSNSNKINEKGLESQRAKDEVKGAKRQLDSISRELSALKTMLEEKSADYNSLLSKSSAFSDQFKSASLKFEKTRDTMLFVKEQLSNLQAEVAKNEELSKMKERELYKLENGEFEDLSGKISEIESKIKEVSKFVQQSQKELDSLFSSEKSLNSNLPQIEDELLRAREKAAELGAKLKNSDSAVVSRALEAVLELKEKISGVHGTVEELCSYSSKFSVPIQVALGPRMQFVVVDSVSVASKAIAVIKERKLGRVSFIPLDKIKVNEQSSIDLKLSQAEGSYGFILEHIEYDTKYAPAFKFACGNTIIINDLKTANSMIGKIRLVTMDGELAEQSGLLSGGSFNAKINIVAEKKQFDNYTQIAKNASLEKDSIISQLEEIRESSQQERKKKSESEVQLKSLEIELSHFTTIVEQEKKKKNDLNSSIDQLKSEIFELSSATSELNSKRSDLVRQLSQLNTVSLELRQKMDLEKESSFGMQLKEKERTLSDLRVKNADYESQFKSITNQLNVYERISLSIEKEFLELIESQNTLEKSIKTLQSAIDFAAIELKEKLIEQKKVSGAMSALLDKREIIESEISKLSNEKGKFEFEREKYQRNLSEIQIRLASIEANLNQLKTQIQELVSSTIIAGKTELDKPELVAQLRLVNERVAELGDVNLRSIELYEQKSKEFEAQKLRVSQLFNEKEAVISIINEVEGKKISTFMSMFNLVNENFKRVFSQIFPGDGHLYLENPTSPFDGGLTIEIKLTNKEVKYLELMSGGEKSLIALIFLFSIQSCNPSSVTILDEADAALDSDNSRKLSELVKAISSETQFIVVSHNQNVYKYADSLVGVAMSDGSSRVVEVKLNNSDTPLAISKVTA